MLGVPSVGLRLTTPIRARFPRTRPTCFIDAFVERTRGTIRDTTLSDYERRVLPLTPEAKMALLRLGRY